MLIISVVLIVFNWPWPARQIRSVALTMRERDFIGTAWFSGESTLTVIRTEIFPYISSWAVGNFINTVLVAIAVEAGLAVIGLSSLQESTLGTMIYWALQYQALLGGRWWWILPPVVAIVTLFIAPLPRVLRLHAVRDRQSGGASVIRVEDVKASYFTPAGEVQAVDRVSMSIRDNEILGIAGESGCGKSTLMKIIYQFIEPPLRLLSGRVEATARGESGETVVMAAPPCAGPGGSTSPTSRRAR